MSRTVPALAPVRWLPGYRVDRYELLSALAEGGMASVWVARLRGEHGFEKLVAIKTILGQYASDPRYEAMFLDEARLIANIRHHNVAEILDLGSDHALPYLVLEWVEGDSLSHLQRAAAESRAPIPVPAALHVAARMCAGLNAAHELRDRSGRLLNVVHRDVSPQNVLLSVTGEVKLIDFGIAKALDQVTADTTSGVLKGKISFMSPEQANGERLDQRTDLWAVGVVLYQLLSGALPFRSQSPQRTLHAIRSRVRPAAIAGLPTMLQKLLDRVLEPERDRRIDSAAELESELERVGAHLGMATTRDLAGLVSEQLGPRIAARRAAIEEALLEANRRAPTEQAVDKRSLPTWRPPRTASTGLDAYRSAAPDDPTISFDGAPAQPISSISLRSEPRPESVTPPDIAVSNSVASELPPRRTRHWPAGVVAVLGVLAAGAALLLPALRPTPSVSSAGSLHSAASVPPTARATATVAPVPPPLDSPPVVQVEDMPVSPALSASAAPRVKRAPRPKRVVKRAAPAPKKDVWSAFSEQR